MKIVLALLATLLIGASCGSRSTSTNSNGTTSTSSAVVTEVRTSERPTTTTAEPLLIDPLYQAISDSSPGDLAALTSYLGSLGEPTLVSDALELCSLFTNVMAVGVTDAKEMLNDALATGNGHVIEIQDATYGAAIYCPEAATFMISIGAFDWAMITVSEAVSVGEVLP